MNGVHKFTRLISLEMRENQDQIKPILLNLDGPIKIDLRCGSFQFQTRNFNLTGDTSSPKRLILNTQTYNLSTWKAKSSPTGTKLGTPGVGGVKGVPLPIRAGHPGLCSPPAAPLTRLTVVGGNIKTTLVSGPVLQPSYCLGLEGASALQGISFLPVITSWACFAAS